MGVDEDWLQFYLLSSEPIRKLWQMNMFVFGLKDGWLVGVGVQTLEDIAASQAWMLENGFKRARFQEAFEPVDGVVVKREKHDKQTKTGKDMWRFYIREGDGTGAEHLVIAFDPTEFKKGDKVNVSMGSFGKQAKHITDGADWDEEPALQPRDMDDIPF
jgi:hypothetical protein